ncbi:MAG: hypothetical protein H0V10_08980 [Geodermatophilaceae bacterium]|nr:hypothetical protein [Geodermatophilaceae bacterium]
MTAADPTSRYRVSLDDLRKSVEIDPADQVTEQPESTTRGTGDSWEREQQIISRIAPA